MFTTSLVWHSWKSSPQPPAHWWNSLPLSHIVGPHSTLFRYTPYIPWEIWLPKSRFHEYAWGRGDQYSSNEIACYKKYSFISMTSYRDFLLKIESVLTWPAARLAQLIEQGPVYRGSWVLLIEAVLCNILPIIHSTLNFFLSSSIDRPFSNDLFS